MFCIQRPLGKTANDSRREEKRKRDSNKGSAARRKHRERLDKEKRGQTWSRCQEQDDNGTRRVKIVNKNSSQGLTESKPVTTGADERWRCEAAKIISLWGGSEQPPHVSSVCLCLNERHPASLSSLLTRRPNESWAAYYGDSLTHTLNRDTAAIRPLTWPRFSQPASAGCVLNHPAA